MIDFLVEEEERKSRLKICKVCPFYFNDSGFAKFIGWFGINIGTCGTPIIGKKIKLNGKVIYKLCGCVMESKASLTDAKCPLKKWNNVLRATQEN